MKGDSLPVRPFEEVLREHTPGLMAVPGVIGTGQGERAGQPILVVYVTRRTPELERRVPREIEGYRVEIRETGQVRALDS